ncbi:adenylate/guanylate cyclase domain-containing protein [Candidatus Peregrinibacteria bacterium]|nr:adenylate/guanylate cyclase domain-containing protein [Candidatus Peregrinibacteria bacterium]
MSDNLDQHIFRQEVDLCGGHSIIINDKEQLRGTIQVNAAVLNMSDTELKDFAEKAAKEEVVSPEIREERKKMSVPLSDDQLRAIQERCDSLVVADGFDHNRKNRVIAKCLKVIQQTRGNDLLRKILGEPVETFIGKHMQDDEVSLVTLVKEANNAAKEKLVREEISIDDYSQFRNIKALLGDIVREKTLASRVDNAEELANMFAEDLKDAKKKLETQEALEEVRTQIDGIIDTERNKSLHSGLAAIANYMRGTLGKNCESVAIAYVNEDNDYEKFDRLTRVTPRAEGKSKAGSKGETKHTAESLSSEDFPAEIFASHINTKVVDVEHGKKYFSVKLGKQCLGIIEVKMKEGQQMTEEQEKKCEKAISVIDTYLDARLMNLRLDKLRKKITRMLDRSGTDTVIQDGKVVRGLRKGLTDAFIYLSKKTGAEQVYLTLDIMGDKKQEPLCLLVSADGELEMTNLEEASSMESIKRPITIPKGMIIDDSTETQVDGQIMFYGHDLDEEDQKALSVAAEQIISAVRNFRVDLNNTVRYGLPPQVALLLKEGRLQTSSVENLSMGFTDIYGFTGISEKFREITSKYGLKENYMVRLVAAYDQMAKDIALDYGGCYDKIVGDCVIVNSGPPYTTDGLDGLGLKGNNDVFHAMNSLKIALRIKQGLPKVERVFHDLLIEMAEEIENKTRGANSDRPKRDSSNPERSIDEVQKREARLQAFCKKFNFYPVVRVTQGISSGETSVGLVEIPDANGRAYSTSYTVIGDEMNLAARLQAKATPEEIIVSKATKDLIDKAIRENLPVPFNGKGQTETWEEFKKFYLGEEYGRYDLKPVYEATMLELKNKSGYEFAYRLSLEKVCVDKDSPDSLPPIILEDSLKKMQGYFKIVSQDPQGDFVEMTLENINQPAQRFKAKIKNAKHEVRYVPDEDCDERIDNGSDNVIRVQNGEIILTDYVSIENLIVQEIGKLKETETYLPSQIPHGIYTVKQVFRIKDSEDVVYVIERNGKTVKVRIDKNSMLELNKLPEKPKAQALYDVHRYSYDKRRKAQYDNLRKQGVEIDKPESEAFIYIHTNGEFVGTTENDLNS